MEFVCREEEVTEGDAWRFLAGNYDLIVARKDGKLYAYRNECPHMNLPLINRLKGLLNKEQGHLICVQHAAVFDIKNGFCVKGPCLGMVLESVEIELIDGGIFLFG